MKFEKNFSSDFEHTVHVRGTKNNKWIRIKSKLFKVKIARTKKLFLIKEGWIFQILDGKLTIGNSSKRIAVPLPRAGQKLKILRKKSAVETDWTPTIVCVVIITSLIIVQGMAIRNVEKNLMKEIFQLRNFIEVRVRSIPRGPQGKTGPQVRFSVCAICCAGILTNVKFSFRAFPVRSVREETPDHLAHPAIVQTDRFFVFQKINMDKLVEGLEKFSFSRTLVILDLNGVLIYRKYKPVKSRSERLPDGAERVKNFLLWRRPGLQRFLQQLFDEYDVAIWSSITPFNMNKMLNYIFTKEQREQLAFVWTQDNCDAVEHPIAELAKRKKLYKKPLQFVWKKFPQYDACNTIIIDDSKLKLQDNPKRNCLILQEWRPRKKIETLNGVQKKIKQRAKSINEVHTL